MNRALNTAVRGDYVPQINRFRGPYPYFCTSQRVPYRGTVASYSSARYTLPVFRAVFTGREQRRHFGQPRSRPMNTAREHGWQK